MNAETIVARRQNRVGRNTARQACDAKRASISEPQLTNNKIHDKNSEI